MQQLQQLSKNAPVDNQQVVKGMDQAREAQFRQAAQAAPAGAPQAAQQLGAQTQQARQQTLAQGAQQNMETQQKLGSLEANQQQMQNQQDLFNRQQGLQKKQRGLENQLASLNEEAKKKIFDDNMKFEKDELGRTTFNDRQLLDYAILNAKSDEDLANFEQQMNFESEKRMNTLRAAQAKIKQSLEQGYDDYNQTLDAAQKMKLVQAQQALEQKMKEESNKAANRASMFGAAGTIGGAVAGAAIGSAVPGVGTAAGAMVGSSIGSGLGSIAGSIFK